MQIIDAYAHVSLPCFVSTDDCLRLMDRHGIEAAVLGTADTCPDIKELSRAIVAHPDRFRALGMPTGETPVRAHDAVRAPPDSGFSGIRLRAALIAARRQQRPTEVLLDTCESRDDAGALTALLRKFGR